MHGPMNGKSPNNTSKWQMGFNSAFKGLISFPDPPLKESLQLPTKNSIYGYSIIIKYSINLQ
jgi:hypothetical protein